MHMHYIVVTWLIWLQYFVSYDASDEYSRWFAEWADQDVWKCKLLILGQKRGNHLWCAKVLEGGAFHLISCVLCCAASWRWQHFSEEIWQGRVLGASSTEGTTGEGYMHNASSSFSLYFINTRENYDHTSLSLHLLLTFLFVCVLLIQEEARKGKGMWSNYSSIKYVFVPICALLKSILFMYVYRKGPSCAKTTFEAQRLWSWSRVSSWQDSGLSFATIEQVAKLCNIRGRYGAKWWKWFYLI